MKVLLLGAGGPPTDTDTPVWLAEQGGRLLIERFVHACAPLAAELVFAVRAEDVERFHIGDVIALAAPGAAVVPLKGETMGAACTALLCVDHIGPDRELLILNSNEWIDMDYAAPVLDFRARGLDAGVVSFPSLHPRYSYVRLDGNGMIEEAAEKRPISRMAMAGYHWFRRGADFTAAAKTMIAKDAQEGGRFYISLTLNELVLLGRRMGIHPIDARRYHPLKSRRQMDQFENSETAS